MYTCNFDACPIILLDIPVVHVVLHWTLTPSSQRVRLQLNAMTNLSHECLLIVDP